MLLVDSISVQLFWMGGGSVKDGYYTRYKFYYTHIFTILT